MLKRQVGIYTATALVIANIIGTGVFTSLGFQAGDINSVFSLLLLWAVGGAIALCGALTYGELAAALPYSGGEYYYLSRIYHPSLGFMGGWVSLIVGFSGPTYLAATAFSKYFSAFFPEADSTHLAAAVVTAITIVHSYKVKTGSEFQVVFTSLKIILIIVFIISGFLLGSQPASLVPVSHDLRLIFSSSFAVSLIYVSYAYSGWNAAVYIASEIRDPLKNLPKSLLIGTASVAVLYILLNFVFLYTSPMKELIGVIDVGHISANHIFGVDGGGIMSMIISLLLVSTISAMIFIGPRVIHSMAEDIPYLRFFSKASKRGVPLRAILFQYVITIVFIYSSDFQTVLNYTGFVLNLSTLITVSGVFVLRYKERNKPKEKRYRTWGYPVTPIIFIILNLWILVSLIIDKTLESVFGLLTVILGMIFYFIGNIFYKNSKIEKYETVD